MIDYIIWCLLDYYYTKYHYRLIANNLSREKKLDADPKAIQQIEFIEQLKILAADAESMFLLIILAKMKATRLKFSQGSVAVL